MCSDTLKLMPHVDDRVEECRTLTMTNALLKEPVVLQCVLANDKHFRDVGEAKESGNLESLKNQLNAGKDL